MTYTIVHTVEEIEQISTTDVYYLLLFPSERIREIGKLTDLYHKVTIETEDGFISSEIRIFRQRVQFRQGNTFIAYIDATNVGTIVRPMVRPLVLNSIYFFAQTKEDYYVSTQTYRKHDPELEEYHSYLQLGHRSEGRDAIRSYMSALKLRFRAEPLLYLSLRYENYPYISHFFAWMACQPPLPSPTLIPYSTKIYSIHRHTLFASWPLPLEGSTREGTKSSHLENWNETQNIRYLIAYSMEFFDNPEIVYHILVYTTLFSGPKQDYLYGYLRYHLAAIFSFGGIHQDAFHQWYLQALRSKLGTPTDLQKLKNVFRYKSGETFSQYRERRLSELAEHTKMTHRMRESLVRIEYTHERQSPGFD